ncbi:MAG: cyclic nucleotide-binding domain-containing protein [Planctomycetes bacterium]|nr:cyclic nucleotide-binding domain-containing protein [Planctomycetota bacterium]
MTNNSLAQLPIFHGMSDDQRNELLAIGHRVEVDAGEQIITQGKLVQNLWFILAGQCEVRRRTEAGCEIKLATLEPNMQFGEMSFFHAAPHSADVFALTDMQLLRLGRDDFDTLCAAGNPVAFKLTMNSLEQLSDRLRRTDEWITNLVCGENHKPTPSEWATFREIIFRGR